MIRKKFCRFSKKVNHKPDGKSDRRPDERSSIKRNKVQAARDKETKHKTQEAKHKVQEAKHKVQEAKYKTYNISDYELFGQQEEKHERISADL